MSRCLVILALCMSLGSGLDAQERACPGLDPTAGAVVGRVVDASTGVGLGFVHLELQGPGSTEPMKAQSDPGGYFTFCTVPPGRVLIHAALGPHTGGAGPVNVEAGGNVELRVELRNPDDNTGTLAGEVVDAETGEAIEGAAVFIRDLGLSAISNELGRFAFPSVPPGNHVMRSERIGYASAEGAVEIAGWRATETQVRLAVKAVALDPIVVTAVRRRVDLPRLDDFERRYYSGWGQFVLEDQIRVRNPTRLTDVLTETGLEITGNGLSVKVRRTNCAPMVYIDGVKMTRLPRNMPPKQMKRLYAWPDPSNSPEEEAADAINMIHPGNILAIEVYRGPGETPGEYLDSNARCGVVLIWSRRGG